MDQQILFLINRQWTTPALDKFMAVMSTLHVWIVPLAVAIIGVVIFGGFKGRAMLVSMTLIVGIGDGLISNSLKKAVGRPRPHQALADVRVVSLEETKPRFAALTQPVKIKWSRLATGQINGRSFPSSHTINNICVATVLAAFYRRWGWLYFLPALAVGYSRIYVGSHWVSDVAVSVFIAIGWSLVALALLEMLWKKMGRRFAEKFFVRHPSLFASTP